MGLGRIPFVPESSRLQRSQADESETNGDDTPLFSGLFALPFFSPVGVPRGADPVGMDAEGIGGSVAPVGLRVARTPGGPGLKCRGAIPSADNSQRRQTDLTTASPQATLRAVYEKTPVAKIGTRATGAKHQWLKQTHHQCGFQYRNPDPTLSTRVAFWQRGVFCRHWVLRKGNCAFFSGKTVVSTEHKKQNRDYFPNTAR